MDFNPAAQGASATHSGTDAKNFLFFDMHARCPVSATPCTSAMAGGLVTATSET
jgi:hypothetical protein